MTDPADAPPFAGTTSGRTRAALLVAWLVVALYLQLHHAPWRDEVRAWSLAVDGRSVVDMLRAIHGEGHPALWYLLLRGTGAIVGGPLALPITGFAVGASGAALLACRAPFRPVGIALCLFGAHVLFEFTVIARNYGLSMVLLFAFADRYPRWRDRGVGLGVILFLLCNANAPSLLLAGGLMLFWAVELIADEGWRWTAAKRVFALNAVIAALGALACVATIWPPYNDAVDFASAGGVAMRGWRALDLTASFNNLAFGLTDSAIGRMLVAAMIVGAPVGLVGRPGGLVAGTAGFVVLGLFFAYIFPGSYRHASLYLAYLVALYWLAAARCGGEWPTQLSATLARWGGGAFAALLALQTIMAGFRAVGVAEGSVFSHSRDLASLLARPPLDRAIVVANPDIMLEALPYYVRNPLYLVRERRFGRVVAFTRTAKRTVTLAETLAAAQSLRARTGRPVAIALHHQLDPAEPPTTEYQGYLGAFAVTPASTRAFLAATRRLARFGPSETDESYDVYLLR